jgi:ppGpp synthetase/RelA/SpoT-type nucleotidyltranferase
MHESNYLRFVRPYDKGLRRLRQDLDFFIEGTGNLQVYLVENRIKAFESALKKQATLGIHLTDLQDIAGLRVVAVTQLDVDMVFHFFKRLADQKDLTIITDEKISRDGYRARHVVVELQSSYLRSPYEVNVEIQISTLLQHAFNHISRKWVYKTDYHVPASSVKELAVVAADLAQLDTRIRKLYESSIANAMATDDDAPLTPSSYQIIAFERFGEQISIEYAVDAVQYLVGFYYETNGRLRELFNSKDMEILFDDISKITHPRLEWIKDSAERNSHNYLFLGPRLENIRKLINDIGASLLS